MTEENKEKQEEIVVDIDMDALSAPDTGETFNEGDVPPQTNDLSNPEEDREFIEESGGQLPNLDEQMDKEMESGDQTEFVEEPSDVDFTKKITDPDNEAVDENSPYYMAPFDTLKERLGDDYEIPEGISEENYFDTFVDQVYKNTNFDEYVHEDVRELNKFLKEGGKMEEYMINYKENLLNENLPPRDLVMRKLSQESPDWSQAKLDNIADKMERSGLLEIEAQRIKNSLRSDRESSQSRYIENQRVQKDKQEIEFKKERNGQITEALKSFNELDNVYGLPVSKAEKQDFLETFKELVTPDGTGEAPLMKMLQSNDTLAKVAYLVSRGDSAIKTALTNAKESTKDAFLDKLDSNPRLSKKSGSQPQASDVNLDALVAPERYKMKN